MPRFRLVNYDRVSNTIACEKCGRTFRVAAVSPRVSHPSKTRAYQHDCGRKGRTA